MNVKKQNFFTKSGTKILIQSEWNGDAENIFLKNRNLEDIDQEKFFEPKISDLHDPFLMPDMRPAVKRILEAIDRNERIVVFGDYDVDGVSATALVVRFLANELNAQISYRLPHRAKDGYGLKEYFFDELAEKNVKLVITVDCGTRDIKPIRHAKKLGIDVIVTDHHAVPNEIPTEVIGILNPKRTDKNYPFPNLAGAGVAFKLIHAILLSESEFEGKIEKILTKYIDFASLGTVSDCMPLVDENRVITTLGLKQMKNSESAGLRKYLEWHENIEWNADIIGFQIGPRINASGRMDTPITALRWLLASENRCDEFLEEIEKLNTDRREVVENFTKTALENVDLQKPILFFLNKNLEHGLIGLVAGKLTESYNRVSIVLCEHHEADGSLSYVASCRAPEWCNIMEILDDSKDFLIRYGGHKQAAGFSVSPENFEIIQSRMIAKFYEIYGTGELPVPTIRVESILPPNEATLKLLESIEKFRPFGIGNPKPFWLFDEVEITEVQTLGSEKKHIKIFTKQHPSLPIIMWNGAENEEFQIGKTISLIIWLDKNIWNEKISLQAFIKEICYKQ